MGFIGAGAIPKWACMVIFCVMILTLEVLGGMNSVVLTDALQHVSTVVVWILMADPIFHQTAEFLYVFSASRIPRMCL